MEWILLVAVFVVVAAIALLVERTADDDRRKFIRSAGLSDLVRPEQPRGPHANVVGEGLHLENRGGRRHWSQVLSSGGLTLITRDQPKQGV